MPMPESGGSNVIGVRDVYDMLAAHAGNMEAKFEKIDAKVDARLDQTDHKVDALTSRMDRSDGRIEGLVSVVKWLGPVGLAGLVYGILKGAGYL